MAPLHAITGAKATAVNGSEQQRAFNEIKKALIEATALAQPDSEGEFVTLGRFLVSGTSGKNPQEINVSAPLFTAARNRQQHRQNMDLQSSP